MARLILASGVCILLIVGCAGTSSYEIVYTHRSIPSDVQSEWGYLQIYRMNWDGTNQQNLSNRDRNEYDAHARRDGQKIVFVVHGNHLYVMDRYMGTVSQVPNTEPYDVSYPKWSRQEIGDWFILFSHPASTIGSAIYRINPDGSGLMRITNPGPNQRDEFPDSVRDQYVVFDRQDLTSGDKDLYLKPLSGTGSELRLTNTPDQSEERPVVSNDGQLLAYRAWSSQGKEQIHVARFVSKIEIVVEKIIDLTPPAQINIHGIHFSPDDKELVISAEVSDVPSNWTNRRSEIFRVPLDGNPMKRLTQNKDEDYHPSASHIAITNWPQTYRALSLNLDDLKLLRAFRDQYLMSTAKGRFYVRFLYNHSEEVLRVLATHPELLTRMRTLIEENRHGISALLEGKEAIPAHPEEIISFLDDFAAKSSFVLRLAVSELRREMSVRHEKDRPFWGFNLSSFSNKLAANH